MKKKNVLLFMLALLFGAKGWAQEWFQEYDTLDQARLMVTYEIIAHQDTNYINKFRKENMMLCLGDSISWFRSCNDYRFEQNMIEKERAGIIETTFFVKEGETSSFHYKICKNYPKGRISYMDAVLMTGEFVFEDDLGSIAWTITDDTATMAGYWVKKALCDYGGRSWEAWFTPELPYSDGPYLFNGLPGLIIKIADTQSHYEFMMLKMEALENPIPITWNDKESIKTTKKAFFKLEDEFLENIAENVMSNVTSTSGHADSTQSKLFNYAKSHNNPIELDRK